MADSETPPHCNVALVEALILEIAVEMVPENLSAGGLSMKIVRDPTDTREAETATQAIRNLRAVGLLTAGDDETVEPTPAGLRAVELFT